MPRDETQDVERRPCACEHSSTNPEAFPLHSCPYQYDVNNDDNAEFCNCCRECTQECADNI